MRVLSLLVLGVALVASTPTVSVPFPTRLFAEISTEYPNENVIFSPASIKSALGLAYMGAEGATATELHNVVQFSGNTKQEVGAEFAKFLEKVRGSSHIQLKTANRIFLSDKYTIAPTYNEFIHNYFDGVTEAVDFTKPATIDKINAWVEEQTNHKIHNIVDSSTVDDSTNAVLVNAIYFKANWKYAFKQQKTLELPFFMSKEQSTPVKMMHETMNVGYAEIPEMNARAIKLPYSGTDIQMLIILPNEIDGLTTLEQKLKDVDLTYFNMLHHKVNVKLPKFKIEFDTSLNNVLKKLGITHMFTDGDFSSMVTSGGGAIAFDDVTHKAFIEVDEHGTEAAAVTSLQYSRSFSVAKELSVDFFVDHPFFFAIVDGTTVYFAGHVTKF